MKNTIEQKMTMIEEQLAQELNKSKSGKLGGVKCFHCWA